MREMPDTTRNGKPGRIARGVSYKAVPIAIFAVAIGGLSSLGRRGRGGSRSAFVRPAKVRDNGSITQARWHAG
jgi:hypothetical protein